VKVAWPTFAIGAVMSTTGLVSAQSERLPLELAWQAPEGCPDRSFVRRRIEQLLHDPVTTPNSVVASATIERSPDLRFHLELSVRTDGVEENRRIDADSCSALAEASAVVIALAIDPSEDAEPPHAGRPPEQRVPEPPPPPSAPSPPPTPRVEPLPPRAPPAARTTPRVAIGVGGSVESGVLPEPSMGFVGSASLRLDRIRAGVLATMSLVQRPRFDRTAGASFEMISAGAFGSYMLPLGALAVGPSANVEITHVRVRGFGIRGPRTSSVLWPTPVLGARLEVSPARWISIVGRADLLIPIGAPAFNLTTTVDAVRLHDPAPVAPRLSIGAEIVFP